MDQPAIDASDLQPTGLFAGLQAADLDDILRVGQPVSFQVDEAIFETGDRGDAMYVIVSGQARVDVGGRFHILKTGDFFGEMALIAPGPRMATVRAVQPVEALTIPASDFQSFLAEHPAIALSMMKALVVRLREVEQRIDAWMG